MKRNSTSNHANILMSGHNPEHHNSHKRHGGGISNVHSNMKPADHMMRSHHHSGGITSTPPHFFSGGITSTPPSFAKGGKAHHRKFATGGHCYAEGGEADKQYGEKPLTGQLRRGGRARRHHSEGESVPEAEHHSRGGRTKHRQHHYEGQNVVGRLPLIGSMAKHISRKVGTFDENKYGGSKYGQHHSEGEPVRKEHKNGGRTKRQHHYWGQDVIGRLPLVGGIANSIANTAGTLDSNKYGGSEYVADTPGRKVADIASHIGNFAAPLLMLKKGGKAHRQHRHHHSEGERVQEGAPVADNSVRKEHHRGGRTKRSHHYWGQDFIGRLPLVGSLANSISGTMGTLDPNQYGGSEYVADTPGRKAADIISTVGNLGTNLLLSAKGGGKGKGGGAPAPKKRGGGVHHRNYRYHHAEGGSGKVRKGMMTNSGHMIHYDV